MAQGTLLTTTYLATSCTVQTMLSSHSRVCPTACSVCAGYATQDPDPEDRTWSNIMGSIRCWLGPKTNQNVSSIFIYKLSNGIARGVWSHASMATYIYVLENQSAKVPSHCCIPDTAVTSTATSCSVTHVKLCFAARRAGSRHPRHLGSVFSSRHDAFLTVGQEAVHCIRQLLSLPSCLQLAG